MLILKYSRKAKFTKQGNTNMKFQFKDTDNQVTIQTEWNSRHIYLTEDYHIDRRRTLMALLKYRANQRLASMREMLSQATPAVRAVQNAPLALWLNATRPVKRAA